MKTKALSLEATIAVTDRSRRTWWRRIAEGTVQRRANDARGRTMLCLADILPHIPVSMTPEDLDALLHADGGEAEAQDEIAQMFLLAGRPGIAACWFRQAADQGHADAMQWLACCHAGGLGVLRDENLALMWLAKAAAHGSVIAQAQMLAMKQGGASHRPLPTSSHTAQHASRQMAQAPQR